jgi:hypothetical protein
MITFSMFEDSRSSACGGLTWQRSAFSMATPRNSRVLPHISARVADFPWLADIRTLAKAEIAHRFSQPDLERRRVDEFMAKQAMLFEPDIPLNFHLLRYQEHLKPRYQAG